jgi:hypothetical protein
MITILLAGLLLAQSPPAKPCSSPEHRQFDFWLGDWDVRGPKGNVAGTNRIEAIENGCALVERWTGAGGMTGHSINAYRPWTKTWHQTWVGSDGLVLLLEGRYENERMVLEGTGPQQDGTPVMNRITWSRLDGAKVRQLWEQSTDQGKTWTVVFDGTYSRRVAPKA